MFALSVAAISLAAANVVGFVALYALAGLLRDGLIRFLDDGRRGRDLSDGVSSSTPTSSSVQCDTGDLFREVIALA
jgi:hypothetical protein